MSYPMQFTFEKDFGYPYRFRFDLKDSSVLPKDQIPHLKNMVNSWLKELEIEYIYRHGLLWCLKHEQDALLFRLRFTG